MRRDSGLPRHGRSCRCWCWRGDDKRGGEAGDSEDAQDESLRFPGYELERRRRWNMSMSLGGVCALMERVHGSGVN